ncbi:MAG: hypothetical protein MZU79_03200 [Anaerotruncus sp.]|nr:hypothetical protein [Anaerotruncus sp.]
MTIAFNARYILDALNVMSADNVMLRLNDPLSSTILTEEGEGRLQVPHHADEAAGP